MKKILTSACLAFTLFSGISGVSHAAATPFSDVAQSHWATTAINQAVSKGYFKGYADGSFKPNAPVTKEEFAVLLSRVSTNDVSGEEAAPSNVVGRWSEVGVKEAIAKGFISNNSISNPQEKITRIEMVRWMVAGLSKTDGSYAIAAEDTIDTIVPVAEFYKGGLNKKDYSNVSVALGTGLMNGFTDGSFGGNQTTTRAEVASILLRLEKIQEKKATDFSQLMEMVEVGLKGSNAETMGLVFSGSNSGNPDDVAAIRGMKHSMKNNKGTMSIDNMIVVDPAKKDSLYYKMFVGKNFSPKGGDSSFMIFTSVTTTPAATVEDWGNQLDWHNSRLTASMPYTSDSQKSYGYPFLVRDIKTQLVKGKTFSYWAFSSITKSGGMVQVKVGDKTLSFSTR